MDGCPLGFKDYRWLTAHPTVTPHLHEFVIEPVRTTNHWEFMVWGKKGKTPKKTGWLSLTPFAKFQDLCIMSEARKQQLTCTGCLSKVPSDPWLHVLMFQLGIDFLAAFCTQDLSASLTGKRTPPNVWLKFNWLFQWRGEEPFHSLFVAPKLCLTCSFVPIQAPATQAATNALILISLHSASLLA